MAILNFPTNPSLDQTYIANNVIYTWNGEYWEANTNSGFDSRYVEVGGDNMTGDLTLGPVGDTQLTLTAASGSITAAGVADFQSSVRFISGIDGADGNPLQMWVTGSVVGGKMQPTLNMWNYDQEHQVNLRGDGTLKLGGLLPNAPNISLNADGSGEFAGSVISGTLTGQYTQINPWGFIKVKSNSSNVANSMATFEGGAGDIQFKVDGSATFAGNIQSNWKDGTTFGCELASQGLISVRNDIANDFVFRAYKNTFADDVAHITNDGSAKFSGNVTQEGGYIRTSTGGTGVSLYATGLMSATTSESSNALVVKNDSSEEKASIKGDGSAKFASNITVSPNPNSNVNTPTTGAGGVGFVGVGSISSNQAGILRWCGNSTSENTLFSVNVGTSLVGYASRTTTGMKIQSGNNGSMWKLDSNGAITAKSVNGASLLIQLEADDDTKYTTTTDADGNETLVYNGAVLDVKDRLTKLDTALSDLKAALVSTTDHASLKAALITALADI